MFNNFKSRLALILLLIGVACYFLVPTYNKYFIGSNYEIVFDSSDQSTPIPPGFGILFETNNMIDGNCLSNFEFYSDNKIDSVEALLLGDSNQLAFDWGELEYSEQDDEIVQINCLEEVDVCISVKKNNFVL